MEKRAVKQKMSEPDPTDAQDQPSSSPDLDPADASGKNPDSSEQEPKKEGIGIGQEETKCGPKVLRCIVESVTMTVGFVCLCGCLGLCDGADGCDCDIFS
jgi:hypothetical protein